MSTWVEETNRFNFLLIGIEILDSRSETDNIPLWNKDIIYNEEFDPGSG